MIGIRIRVLRFNGDEAGAQDYAASGFNSPGTAGVRRTRATVLLRMGRLVDYGKNQKR